MAPYPSGASTLVSWQQIFWRKIIQRHLSRSLQRPGPSQVTLSRRRGRGLIIIFTRFGLFWEKNEPTIFLRDIELIKRVQVTDFEHFMDFGFLPNEFVENAGNQFGVADLRGESWRKMKRMVTPPFRFHKPYYCICMFSHN